MLNSQTLDVKTRTYLIVLLVFMGLMAGMSAYAQESIRSFQTHIEVNEDASITVTERIEYDFGDGGQQDIRRIVPVPPSTTSDAQDVDFSVLEVLRNGRDETYRVATVGDQKQIIIGDSAEVSGLQTYVIEYRVNNAIDSFDDYDELRWSVIAEDIELSVGDAFVDVTLPGSVLEDSIQADCYLGSDENADRCTEVTISDSSVTAEAQEIESRSGGVTLVVKFPKGVVSQISWHNKISQWISVNSILIFSGATLLFLLYFWFTRKRDSRGEEGSEARDVVNVDFSNEE